jgi:N-acetylmuramoyl-L-alanine amidase
VFDEAMSQAVRAFQQARGLNVDGVVDTTTYRALEEARWRLGDRLLTHVPGNLIAGDDVIALQRRLLDLGFQVGRVDGRYGAQTERAVRDFQRNIGVPPDGTCGPATLKALGRLAPLVSGGNPNAMRAEERLRRAGPRLSGKTVVIDPAAARVDDPALQARALEITSDLAARIEGRLLAIGVQALLTNPGRPDSSGDLSQTERAEFANRTDADLCLSINVECSPNPEASGVATYFFGLDAHGVRSSVGERVAGLVQREIVARTGAVNLRSHAKTWDLLRRTTMPTVQVDVGYISNERDAARMSEPGFRDAVAEAVVVAAQRVYLSPESDSKTGVLRLSDLREAVRSAGEQH